MIGSPKDDSENSLKIWQTKVAFWQACLIAIVPTIVLFLFGNSSSKPEHVELRSEIVKQISAPSVYVKMLRKKLSMNESYACNIYLLDRFSALETSDTSDVKSGRKGLVKLFGECLYGSNTIVLGAASTNSSEAKQELLKLETDMMNISLSDVPSAK